MAYFIEQQASFGEAEAAEDLFARWLSGATDKGEDGPLVQGGKYEKREKSLRRISCASGSVRP